ncbi:MAG: hypothetical protein JW743_06380 [Deltaproteobacteria bacterium]|nr:hypothetical protein [Deltaproteobacteria bacterium]MBN2845300.1 hypothetical protein [Deltaproteobacteria bacterium]
MNAELTPMERIERRRKHVTAACISDIFLHYQEERRKKFKKNILDYVREKKQFKYDCKELFIIHPDMTEIKQVNKAVCFNTEGRSEGIRGKITEFSSGSRRNFIKFFCKLKDKPKLWQDFTFADDVMEGASIGERRNVSNKALNRFRRTIKEKYPSLWIVYKREWEPRKSGKLKGEYIPHFHMFIGGLSDREDYLGLAAKLAVIWVHSTRTTEIEKSLRVSLHEKSYRLIESQDLAIKYATKYVTKGNGFKTDESIGRSWGTIGDVVLGDPVEIEVTPDEAVKIRRLFRKKVPRNHYLQNQLRNKETSTFVIIKAEAVLRYLEYIRIQHENEVLTYFKKVA